MKALHHAQGLGVMTPGFDMAKGSALQLLSKPPRGEVRPIVAHQSDDSRPLNCLASPSAFSSGSITS